MPPVKTDPLQDPKRCGHHGHRNSAGEPCGGWLIPGTYSCKRHSGKTLEMARAEGRVRLEAQRWGLGDPDVDPGKTLLRLVSQASARADHYAAEQARVVDQCDGDLQKALIGEVWVSDENGGSHKSGEYIRALTRLEADERDRLANFCKLAIAAGLAERQVRLAEHLGAEFAQVIAGVARALGHDPSEPGTAALIRQAISTHAGVGPLVLEGSVAA